MVDIFLAILSITGPLYFLRPDGNAYGNTQMQVSKRASKQASK